MNCLGLQRPLATIVRLSDDRVSTVKRSQRFQMQIEDFSATDADARSLDVCGSVPRGSDGRR